MSADLFSFEERVQRIDRRDFLRAVGLGASSFVIGIDLSSRAFADDGDRVAPAIEGGAAFRPSVYIEIEPGAEKVRVVCHRSEMGQGVRTSMPMLIADELRVSLDDLEIVQAVGDKKYGNQNTDGSSSVIVNWDFLRQAGAICRQTLLFAAAKAWSVPLAECTAEDGHIHHKASGRSKRYGELAEAARDVPEITEAELLDPSEYKLIGKSAELTDAADIVRGSATYGIDARLPGMLFASIERSPTVGGSAKTFDADAAKGVKGVVDVVPLDGVGTLSNSGIAVVATNTWAAIQGRRKLQAEWTDGPVAESHEAYGEKMESLLERNGRSFRSDGDFDAAWDDAEKNDRPRIDVRFRGPYLAHSPMEPPNCVAHVTENRAEIWAPTQHPQWARSAVADLLGLRLEQVVIHVTLLGGGFGRKSKPDFILECAQLSQRIGQPVQVTWKREDEIRHGMYRARNAQRVRVVLDNDGKPAAWCTRSVFPTIIFLFNPETAHVGQNEMGQGLLDFPYDIPHVRMEGATLKSSQRIGWMRSVCHTFHAYANCTVLDELAQKAAVDPIQYSLELLGEPRVNRRAGEFDIGRFQNVIRRVRERSGWDSAVPEGRARGFAAHRSFRSYVAVVAEVSDEGGLPKVHRVHVSIDSGRIVHPDMARAQVEGAVAFAMSYVLHQELTVENSRIQQSNFHDYPMLRISEMPEVVVDLVPSTERPVGIGEPGVPPVPPAIANAHARLTGRRTRDLPFRI